MNTINRRLFLTTGLSLAGGVMLPSTAQSNTQILTDMQEKLPPLAPELVRDFVIAGHANLLKVTEMLNEQPHLLNATWDWSNGDFETALGGAGHMGNREIAEYLLSKGARLDIFGAAMLGKLDVVKALLTAYPNLKASKGPHGLMLLHHAQKGGAGSKEVLEYLMEIGAG